MPSKFSLNLFPAALLAALLLLHASGAPTPEARTDSSAGDSSGEEGEETSELRSIWEVVLESTKQHQKQFEDEFQKQVDFLAHHKKEPFPTKCQNNCSKEACLQKLAQGLVTYKVLLKHVQLEYPNCSILAAPKLHIMMLVTLIKEKMKHPNRVTALTSSQEEQLLKEVDNPDTFNRKMTAHSILRYLHLFLVDGRRSLVKMEKREARMANRNVAPISLGV
ncbi:interleukin-6 [Embiotoca jacksoni]|uniref:interleukin-6 n=1 Tax=Embiotoca jacksoni TaxID=100190 RepID=UPI003703E45A